MTGLFALLVLAATAEGPPPPGPLLSEPPVQRSYPKFGLMLDAGLPDGIGASVVFRPVRLVNLSAGAVTSGVSAGARAGVFLMPLGGFFRPTVGVEAGRMFQGQVPWVLETAGARPYADLAKRVEYDFANLQLGLEVGTRNISVFARAGLSQVHARVLEVEEAALATGGAVTARGLHLRFRGPSVKLGLIANLD
jgi:hypothetical protein